MSQTVLNRHQTHWLIQLTLYNFTIQYCWDSLNSADELLWRSDYIEEWDSEKIYILECSEDKLTSVLTSDSSLMPAEDSSMLSQVIDLISMLANKLATATHRVSMQCFLIETSDFQTESLIWVLFLQVII